MSVLDRRVKSLIEKSAWVLLAVAGGCASVGSISPGKSSMDDVRSTLGRPSDIRWSPAGREIWEYATGPEGDETYVITFNAAGTVLSVRQALSAESIGAIRVGSTTKAQVRDLLGLPGDAYTIGAMEVWEWRYTPAGFSSRTLVVQFKGDGTVAEILELQDPSGGRNHGRR